MVYLSGSKLGNPTKICKPNIGKYIAENGISLRKQAREPYKDMQTQYRVQSLYDAMHALIEKVFHRVSNFEGFFCFVFFS